MAETSANHRMKAVIFAAGKGERMMPLTMSFLMSSLVSASATSDSDENLTLVPLGRFSSEVAIPQ